MKSKVSPRPPFQPTQAAKPEALSLSDVLALKMHFTNAGLLCDVCRDELAEMENGMGQRCAAHIIPNVAYSKKRIPDFDRVLFSRYADFREAYIQRHGQDSGGASDS